MNSFSLSIKMALRFSPFPPVDKVDCTEWVKILDCMVHSVWPSCVIPSTVLGLRAQRLTFLHYPFHSSRSSCTASDPPALSLLQSLDLPAQRLTLLRDPSHSCWVFLQTLCVHGDNRFPACEVLIGSSEERQGVFLLLLVPEGSFLPSAFGGICWWSLLGLGLSL